MANYEHVAIFRQGREAWNNWRETCGTEPDLSGEVLEDAILDAFDLSNVDFNGSNLRRAHLSLSNLQGAILEDANLQSADLSGVSLAGADSRKQIFVTRLS